MCTIDRFLSASSLQQHGLWALTACQRKFMRSDGARWNQNRSIYTFVSQLYAFNTSLTIEHKQIHNVVTFCSPLQVETGCCKRLKMNVIFLIFPHLLFVLFSFRKFLCLFLFSSAKYFCSILAAKKVFLFINLFANYFSFYLVFVNENSIICPPSCCI